MSLQIWLPLNGNLNNQGLSKINITNNGAIIDDNGKIGKCYAFNTVGNYIQTNYNFYPGTNDFSIACWFYLTENTNQTYQHICSFKTTAAASAGIAMIYHRGQQKFLWSTANGSTAQEIWSADSFPTSTIYNTWHHLIMIRDNNDNKHGYFYLDGIRKELASTPTILNITTNANQMRIGSCGASYNPYYWTGKLNDFRLYDHALSKKEAEEIAKGLILHYKLDDPASIEKTINLCNGATCGTQASATSPATWGAHKYYTVLEDTTANDPVPFQKKSVMTIDFNTSYGSGGGASVYPPVSFNIEPSTTYIYSRYIKPSDDFVYTHANFLYRYEYASGGGTRLIEGGVFNKTNTEYLGNGWYRCWGSFTSQATAATVTLPFYTYPGKSVIYELGGIQLEKNTHITPYVTSSNTPIIIDSSGYNNNGTIAGTLTVSENTSKYKYSTIFDGNTAAIQTPNLKTMITDKTYTISCWTYKTQIGSKNYQTIYGGPSGFELEARSSSTTNPLFRIHNWGGGTTPYEFGQWYHFCFVHTNDNSKLYINGELKITGTSTNIPSGNYFIGAWNTSSQQNYDGNISDFRIYATALTPEQVLELYNTSATIDNKGNIYARELVES